MATVYEIKIVSHWVNMNPKRLEKIIKEAIDDKTIDNVIEIEVERK